MVAFRLKDARCTRLRPSFPIEVEKVETPF
jgi:hypothetical protein